MRRGRAAPLLVRDAEFDTGGNCQANFMTLTHIRIENHAYYCHYKWYKEIGVFGLEIGNCFLSGTKALENLPAPVCFGFHAVPHYTSRSEVILHIALQLIDSFVLLEVIYNLAFRVGFVQRENFKPKYNCAHLTKMRGNNSGGLVHKLDIVTHAHLDRNLFCLTATALSDRKHSDGLVTTLPSHLF